MKALLSCAVLSTGDALLFVVLSTGDTLLLVVLSTGDAVLFVVLSTGDAVLSVVLSTGDALLFAMLSTGDSCGTHHVCSQLRCRLFEGVGYDSVYETTACWCHIRDWATKTSRW